MLRVSALLSFPLQCFALGASCFSVSHGEVLRHYFAGTYELVPSRPSGFSVQTLALCFSALSSASAAARMRVMSLVEALSASGFFFTPFKLDFSLPWLESKNGTCSFFLSNSHCARALRFLNCLSVDECQRKTGTVFFLSRRFLVSRCFFLV